MKELTSQFGLKRFDETDAAYRKRMVAAEGRLEPVNKAIDLKINIGADDAAKFKRQASGAAARIQSSMNASDVIAPKSKGTPMRTNCPLAKQDDIKVGAVILIDGADREFRCEWTVTQVGPEAFTMACEDPNKAFQITWDGFRDFGVRLVHPAPLAPQTVDELKPGMRYKLTRVRRQLIMGRVRFPYRAATFDIESATVTLISGVHRDSRGEEIDNVPLHWGHLSPNTGCYEFIGYAPGKYPKQVREGEPVAVREDGTMYGTESGAEVRQRFTPENPPPWDEPDKWEAGMQWVDASGNGVTRTLTERRDDGSWKTLESPTVMRTKFHPEHWIYRGCTDDAAHRWNSRHACRSTMVIIDDPFEESDGMTAADWNHLMDLKAPTACTICHGHNPSVLVDMCPACLQKSIEPPAELEPEPVKVCGRCKERPQSPGHQQYCSVCHDETVVFDGTSEDNDKHAKKAAADKRAWSRKLREDQQGARMLTGLSILERR